MRSPDRTSPEGRLRPFPVESEPTCIDRINAAMLHIRDFAKRLVSNSSYHMHSVCNDAYMTTFPNQENEMERLLLKPGTNIEQLIARQAFIRSLNAEPSRKFSKADGAFRTESMARLERIHETITRIESAFFDSFHRQITAADMGNYAVGQHSKCIDDLGTLRSLFLSLEPTEFRKQFIAFCTQKTHQLEAAQEDAETALGKRKCSMQDMYRALNTHGFLDDLEERLKELRSFLMLTVIVKEQQLMPVTFTDNNAIALKDAMPPFMMGKYDGRKKDARPTNISLDAHKPVTILTGQNMSGKSKAAESVILNAILAQATGHAFVSGGVFSPRKEFHMLGSTSEEVTDTDGSRGFREMEKIGDLLSANREQSLIVLDEILTSTDGPGAFAIQAAAIEEMTRNGALMIMTIHSRATERAARLKIPGNARYLQPVYDRGNPTYRWKPGVERANPHQLANNCGVNPGIIQRAQEIEKMLDMD